MDFFELIEKRCSIRAFKAEKITKEKLQRILDSANRSPSAGNCQGYDIFVVASAKKRKELAQAAYNQNFIAEAPIVLVFCANKTRSSSRYGKRGATLYSVQDATIATTHTMLAAENLGLASCWVGAYDDKKVQEILSIKEKDNLIPVAILPIGYANEAPSKTPRRSLTSLIHEVT